jgi:hypothetical protein
MNKRILSLVAALALIFSLSVVALADIVRLKDGSVIRGQIIAFNNEQFTVLVGAGSRGRRSQITIWMEDVASIEFESAGSAPVTTSNETSSRPPTQTTTRPPVQRPDASQPTRPEPDNTVAMSQPTTPRQPASQGSSNFIQVKSQVRGDAKNSGWTNSGLVVRRGQLIRTTATGSVSIGGGRVSTPAGIPAIRDPKKLMPNQPTGALVAVIGDDNDDFIFLGRSREFVAQRDGILFLGVNEDDLTDNTGAYDVVIEAEVMSGTR